jgi:hypothetical protein
VTTHLQRRSIILVQGLLTRRAAYHRDQALRLDCALDFLLLQT